METREGHSQCAVICNPQYFCSNHFSNLSKPAEPARKSLFELHHAVKVHETLASNGTEHGGLEQVLLEALDIHPTSEAGQSISLAFNPVKVPRKLPYEEVGKWPKTLSVYSQYLDYRAVVW